MNTHEAEKRNLIGMLGCFYVYHDHPYGPLNYGSLLKAYIISVGSGLLHGLVFGLICIALCVASPKIAWLVALFFSYILIHDGYEGIKSERVVLQEIVCSILFLCTMVFIFNYIHLMINPTSVSIKFGF